MPFGIAFERRDNPDDTLYYTGKAGPEWLSKNPADAFCAFDEKYAISEGWAMKGRSFVLDGYVPITVHPAQFVVESDGGHTD